MDAGLDGPSEERQIPGSADVLRDAGMNSFMQPQKTLLELPALAPAVFPAPPGGLSAALGVNILLCLCSYSSSQVVFRAAVMEEPPPSPPAKSGSDFIEGEDNASELF